MPAIFKASEFLCSSCISDYGLKRLVEQAGTALRCSSCLHEHSPAVTFGKLSGWMKEIWVKWVEVEWESIDIHTSTGPVLKDLSGIQGKPAREFLADMTGLSGGALNTVLQLLELSNNAECTTIYKKINIGPTQAATRWAMCSLGIRYQQRFYNRSAERFWEELFRNVDTMKRYRLPTTLFPAPIGGVSFDDNVVRSMAAGSLKLYRARKVEHSNHIEYLDENATTQFKNPPSEFSSEGRMNPAGISYLYAALDRDTCVAELRPSIGDKVVTAELEIIDELRLLDFSALENSLHDHKVSYFDDEFEENEIRSKLVTDLHGLISKPVTPHQKSDYLMTQFMAEYLANRHKSKIDGIIFASSQRLGGVNVVVFPQLTPDFKLDNLPQDEDEYSLYQVMCDPQKVTVHSGCMNVNVIPGSLVLHHIKAVCYEYDIAKVKDGKTGLLSEEDY